MKDRASARRFAVGVAAACCVLATVMYAYAEGNSRKLAIAPVLYALYLLLEHPGPGAGVGKPAGALPALRFIVAKRSSSTPAPPPLGDGGAPLAGHFYLVVFFDTRRACLKAALRVDIIARKLHAAEADKWFHTLLVSRDDLDALAAASKHWPEPRLTPMAHDTTEMASANYISEHRAYAQPHAFLIDDGGVIRWHGQINRKQLPSEVANVLRERAKAEKAAAKAQVKGGEKAAQPAKGDPPAQVAGARLKVD